MLGVRMMGEVCGVFVCVVMRLAVWESDSLVLWRVLGN